MSVPATWVLHVDLDQFVAAVEVLRRPELAGKPVVVGGRGDPTERGVVSTASYEAREFGVHSGLPLRVAARKLPDAVFLPGRRPGVRGGLGAGDGDAALARCRRRGARVGRGVPRGADRRPGGARPRLRRRRCSGETRLHCSVGIGDNKVRAKIATEFGKPAGIFRLTAENWFEVMGHRPTRELWGVGSKVSGRLTALGITTVQELADADADVLVAEFGPKMGLWYHGLGQGLGPTTVDDTPWVPRGHSRETTFQQNLTTPDQVRDAVQVARAARCWTTSRRTVGRWCGSRSRSRYAPFVTKTHEPQARRADP